MAEKITKSLRLTAALWRKLAQEARKKGVSVNALIALTLAEKLSQSEAVYATVGGE